MAEQIKPVRGMNDILPEDAPYWDAIESSAAELFAAYGYQRIRIPVLERTELFARSIGELTDIVEKEMYTFEDRNGDSVTMRPEATAGIIRAGLSNGLLHNQQQKLWCSGPMFRHERPQKGRYRQFHQLSIEALGYLDAEVDAELIVMGTRLWQTLGLKSVRLEMNSLGTPESRAEYKKALIEYFSSHRDSLDADSERRLERNPMRILDSKNQDLAELISGAPLLPDYLDDESRAHFDLVQTLLGDSGVEFELNPRLVRGLDYYSRTVFEWLTDELGAQNAICSGGRYDGLVALLGGRDTPGVGWALGVERIVELMRSEASDVDARGTDVFMVSVGDEARRRSFALGETLRRQVPGLTVVCGQPTASLKSQLKRADKLGARFALIIGADELAAGKATLKPMLDATPQEMLDDEEITARVKAGAWPVQ